jgi:hypothetical protein
LGNILQRRPTRLALAILSLSLAASALIGIAIILFGDFDETELRVLATASSLAGFSILSLPSLFHLERDRYKYLAWPGILSSLTLFTTILFLIWGGNIVGGEAFWKTLASVGIISVSTNHALLLLIPASTKILISICQRATILIIACVCALMLSGIWTEEMPETMMRLLGALGVMDVLGTVTVPILVRISRIH